MTLTLRLVLIVIAAAPILGAQQVRQSQASAGASIGVMRADGLLLPLAAVRDDGGWQALVEHGGGSRMTFQARRLRLDGWLLAERGGNPRPFRLTKPMSV